MPTCVGSCGCYTAAIIVGIVAAGNHVWAQAAPPVAATAAVTGASHLRKTDICVYTATPSGILAAVAAKRTGKDVLVVEPSRWVGGMLGAGIKPKQDCPMPEAVGGLAKEVITSFGNTPEATRAAFLRLLKENQVTVLYEHRVCGLDKQGTRITRVRFEKAPPDRWGCPIAQAQPGTETTIEAKVFIDASYEGDLLARAGVEYAIGRESRSKYHEEHAGVGPLTNVTPIDPYVTPGDASSGLLPWIKPDHGKALGEGDDYTQAYNFRFYLTADPQKRVPLTPSEDYDPKQFELVGRYVEYLVAQAVKSGGRPPLDKIFPGWLNSGEYNYFRESLVSIAPLGASRRYQDGDYAARAAIWKMHIDYLRGLQHFMATDPRVPKEYRDKVAQLGLDRRHHPETEGWPHQLYVRVARRMVGRYVLTEADVKNRTTADDSIGLALYGVDTYPVRRVVVRDPKNGKTAVATEGNMFLGGNRGTGIPYVIPYRAITPKEDQCTNLLAPVCFSASYIAYASSRMEPVFMLVGESAGMAAAQAIDQKADVQQLDVSRLQKSLRSVGQLITWPSSAGGGPAAAKHAIATSAALQARIPAQLHITQPDFVVFVPELSGDQVSDTGNEHFLVFDGPHGSLMAVWTRSSAEMQPDQHIAFARSTDEGVTWSKPRIIAGPKKAGEAHMASWAYPLVSKSGRIYVLYSQHVGKFDTFFHHTGWLHGIASDDNGQTWSLPENIREYGPADTSHNRRPVYLVGGYFQAGADQPVWSDEPKFFMDHDGTALGKPGTAGRTDLALYGSFTVGYGKSVLWYPDRKFFLLGRVIGNE